MTKPGKKRRLCRLGLHSYWSDAAMFNLVSRCHHCDWVDSQRAAEALDAERKLWSQAPDSMSSDDKIGYVAAGITAYWLSRKPPSVTAPR